MEESTDGSEEGFYKECASGRDFILVKTHFAMGVNVLIFEGRIFRELP